MDDVDVYMMEKHQQEIRISQMKRMKGSRTTKAMRKKDKRLRRKQQMVWGGNGNVVPPILSPAILFGRRY